jgi:23S rRNA (pseudouridine1915-N3)-methyltransferase
MRILLACVGRSKAGAERDLAARYIERARAAGRAIGFANVELRELEESRARRTEDRKTEEAKAIKATLTPGGEAIALDEGGKLLSSRDFAFHLGERRDQGVAALALLVGGPDGLEPGFRDSASLILSLGPMTLPHQLARIIAAEQIYRAITILSGHPYHRD